MDDVYDAITKNVKRNLNRQYGDKNTDIKLIQELIIMDDGTPEYKERIDKSMERLRYQNEKMKNEIEGIFTATIDSAGNVIPLEDVPR